jgi:hypothetical protein
MVHYNRLLLINYKRQNKKVAHFTSILYNLFKGYQSHIVWIKSNKRLRQAKTFPTTSVLLNSISVRRAGYCNPIVRSVITL